MAFSGTIADWSFADILQVISAQRKSGTLSLLCGDERVTIRFSDGRITAADLQAAARHSGFLRFLVDTGRLAPVAARQAVQLLQQRDGDAMMLVESTKMLPDDVLAAAIPAYVQELIYHILTWEEGEYAFTAHDVTPEPGRTPLPSEGLLFEGMRRLDEWSRISDLVQPEALFRLIPGATIDPALPRRERALLRLIDGIQDVRALHRLAPLTEYEVGEALQTLHQAGLIELCTDGEGPREILELAADDLVPVPRFQRLLRMTSLIMLVTASLLFGLITHGTEWMRSGDTLTVERDQQAIRFALELYRQERGAYPVELEELNGLGMTLHGADRRLAYRLGPRGQTYMLVSSAPTPTPGPVARCIEDWRRRMALP